LEKLRKNTLLCSAAVCLAAVLGIYCLIYWSEKRSIAQDRIIARGSVTLCYLNELGDIVKSTFELNQACPTILELELTADTARSKCFNDTEFASRRNSLVDGFGEDLVYEPNKEYCKLRYRSTNVSVIVRKIQSSVVAQRVISGNSIKLRGL